MAAAAILAVILFAIQQLPYSGISPQRTPDNQSSEISPREGALLNAVRIKTTPVIQHTSVLNDRQMVTKIAEMCKVKEVDCRALYSGSRTDIERAKGVARNMGTLVDDSVYMNWTANCHNFQSERGYIMSSLTNEEKNFPLAFSMVVFKDTEMVERLLRAIYRPQNYYCIHVDQKSSDVFYKSMLALSNCFTNVFVVSKRIDVQWAWFSVLEPELLCMEELWRFPDWKYFLTLTGQEFPLKTNFELVKIFKTYDGANDLEGTIKR